MPSVWSTKFQVGKCSWLENHPITQVIVRINQHKKAFPPKQAFRNDLENVFDLEITKCPGEVYCKEIETSGSIKLPRGSMLVDSTTVWGALT